MVVTQHGPKPLLMLEGALLGGGRQHRVLTHDVLMATNRSTPIDVRCVESGRGHGDTTQAAELQIAPLAVPRALRGIRPDGRPTRDAGNP